VLPVSGFHLSCGRDVSTTLPITNKIVHGTRTTRAGEPEKEIQQPLAVVIRGGIVTSTFLTMIVIRLDILKYRSSFGAS
jgi:hypothetical protein